MSKPRPDSLDTVDRVQTFVDWAQINRTYLVAGAILVAVAGLSYWFYAKSLEIRIDKAGRALLSAKQSIQAGNAGLAQSDLQRLVASYGDTPAAAEGAMLLAQIDYDQGKYQDGINVLQKVANGRAGFRMRTDLMSLVGDGYSQMRRATDAASAYKQAADAAGFPEERDYELAKAARTLASAGKKADAEKIWSDLAKDDKVQSIAAEAKVRLAELTAKPAT